MFVHFSSCLLPASDPCIDLTSRSVHDSHTLCTCIMHNRKAGSKCHRIHSSSGMVSGQEHLYLALHHGAAGGAHALRELGRALRAAADVAAGQEQHVSRPAPAQRALHLPAAARAAALRATAGSRRRGGRAACLRQCLQQQGAGGVGAKQDAQGDTYKSSLLAWGSCPCNTCASLLVPGTDHLMPGVIQEQAGLVIPRRPPAACMAAQRPSSLAPRSQHLVRLMQHRPKMRPPGLPARLTWRRAATI